MILMFLTLQIIFVIFEFKTQNELAIFHTVRDQYFSRIDMFRTSSVFYNGNILMLVDYVS